MASYRYERWINPSDLAPEPQREYTRAERWANWWDYNWKWVLLALAAVALAAYWAIDRLFFTVEPDYGVAVVAPFALPEETQKALQQQLAAFGEDLNGDGQVLVQVNMYQLDYDAHADPYYNAAASSRLEADVTAATQMIFLLYDAAGFERQAGVLRYMDGSLPEPGYSEDWWNMVYQWQDCPVLASLALGSYAAHPQTGEAGSSQALLAGFYVGCCGGWTEQAAQALAPGWALWQTLTQGAAALAAPQAG